LGDADGNNLVFEHLKKDRTARIAGFFKKGGIEMPRINEPDHADVGALTLMNVLENLRNVLENFHGAFPDKHWGFCDWQMAVDRITCAIDDLLNLKVEDEEGDPVPHNEEQRLAIDALAEIVGDYRALPDWTYERLREAVPLATAKEFKRVIGNHEGHCLWYAHRENIRRNLMGPINHKDAVLYRRLLGKQGIIDLPLRTCIEANPIRSTEGQSP
jgi:hypothetical protein